MIYLTFYNLIANYVCTSQSMAVVALVSTLMTEDDVNAAIDPAAVCTEGFNLMYNAIWYTGDKYYVFGNNDIYNYTPTSA